MFDDVRIKQEFVTTPNAGKFLYRPNASKMSMAALLCTAGAGFFYQMALNNDKGLTIDSLIRLGPSSATIVYWVLFGASVIGVAAAGLGVIASQLGDRFIVLEGRSISIPKGLWGKAVRTVAYTEITGLSLQSVRSQKWLILQSANPIRINIGWLPSPESFQIFYGMLTDKIAKSKEVVRPKYFWPG